MIGKNVSLWVWLRDIARVDRATHARRLFGTQFVHREELRVDALGEPSFAVTRCECVGTSLPWRKAAGQVKVCILTWRRSRSSGVEQGASDSSLHLLAPSCGASSAPAGLLFGNVKPAGAAGGSPPGSGRR